MISTIRWPHAIPAGGVQEDNCMPKDLELAGYEAFLRDLKERIQQAQVRAALAVNRELVLLYWRIGRDILRR